jgi:hypothetical protein
MNMLVSTKPGRQSTEGYAQGSRLRQTGVQATNEMVMQNNTQVYPGSGRPCGRNTLRPALLCYCCLEQCITS